MGSQEIVELVSIRQLLGIAQEIGLEPTLEKLAGHGEAVCCRFPSGVAAAYLLCEGSAGDAFALLCTGPKIANGEKAVNAWNSGSCFGAAFVDGEGQACLHYAVTVRGGATRDNICFQFGLFEHSLAKFLDTVRSA